MIQNNVQIGHPLPSQIDNLRHLWKDTFGDSEAFLDLFFGTAFSFDRCMCAVIDNNVIATLYWFNCEFKGKSIAYIYAVATAKEFRGQGLCHQLMEYTHNHLKENGYAGAILSPAEDSLFEFYEKMGYKTCAYNRELIFTEDTLSSFEHKEINLRKINKAEFAKLRREYLPADAVLQENENLGFLETQANFYAGEDFILTAQISNSHLHGIEFLGDETLIPNILKTLSCYSGYFRMNGNEKPFGMYYPLTSDQILPSYLGFAFD